MIDYSVAKFRSRSQPNKVYVVRRDDQGRLVCNCPGWHFSKRAKRTCRHVDQTRKLLNQSRRIQEMTE